jgi:serine/threonine-protein kinase HipA
MADREVEVVVQISREDVPAGRLWSHRRRGVESSTFAYAPGYLARSDAYALDPMLPLADGQQQTPPGRPIFGALSDCSPDGWGRRLIGRAERKRAKRERDVERSFGEVDYLLGARDDMRQGALRFRQRGSASFLAEEDEGVPPLLQLGVLLEAAGRLERDEVSEDELRTLLRGGSSLGGARPKAHVLDVQGKPAIAKFPGTANDEWDVVRWEWVALQLARAAGLEVPAAAVHVVDGKPVLIVDRFDRSGSLRIGYASAMTMLESADGERGSYLEIADVIERHSPNAGRDLEELWRRIAFSILISNTDDHLRNHGFLRSSTAGWTLAPAFDLNPNPGPGTKYLSTAIDFDDPSASLRLLAGVRDAFRLDRNEARRILEQVGGAVGRWRAVAAKSGLDHAEIEQMSLAFEHGQPSPSEVL